MQQNVKAKKNAPMSIWGFTENSLVFVENIAFYKNVQYENTLKKTRGFLSFCRNTVRLQKVWVFEGRVVSPKPPQCDSLSILSHFQGGGMTAIPTFNGGKRRWTRGGYDKTKVSGGSTFAPGKRSRTHDGAFSRPELPSMGQTTRPPYRLTSSSLDHVLPFL